MAALITAVVALAGLWRASGNDGGDPPATPSAPATVEALPEATQPDTTTTTMTASTGTAGEVIHRGEVTLMDQDNVDLSEGVVSNGVANDLFLSGSADPANGALFRVLQAMVISEKPGTRAGCVEALTARRVDRLPLPELKTGTWVCLTTEEGYVAALRIVSPFAIGNPKLAFAYTVWR